MNNEIEICPEILALAKTMQFKLDKNKHKECPIMNPAGDNRHWSHCAVDWLYGRILDEWEELGEALDVPGDGSEDLLQDILHECADVANFAMMIHDNVSKTIDP